MRQSLLRHNERVIRFPVGPPDIPLEAFTLASRIRLQPGQYLAMMDPPPQEVKGFLLPSGGDGIRSGSASTVFQPDACTILKLGPIPEPSHPKHEAALKMHMEIDVGDHVVITPWVNRFSSHGGIPGAHIGGLDGDEWLDTTVAKRIEGGWKLLGNWLQVKLYNYMDVISASYRGRPKRVFEDWGFVCGAGTDAMTKTGQEIVVLGKGEVRPYDSKFFVAQDSPFGDDVIFFREASWQVARNHTQEYVSRVGAVIEA